MIVFHVDLDNTLIYSYKHVLAVRNRENWLNVEIYHGREISFITKKTYELLLELKKHVLIVPTTTRTNEQYGRIDLHAGNFEFALTCNGGVLLHNGKSDDAWYQQSKSLVENSRGEMQKAIGYLQREENRIFEIRWIEEMFVFTKCQNPKQTVCRLRERLDERLAEVFCNGEKVYVLPKSLNKGTAVRRFRDYIGVEKSLAAGDSIFDLPMLVEADLAAAPTGDIVTVPTDSSIHLMSGKEIFSEEMLEFMLSACIH